MQYYIIDDDVSIVKILTNLLKENGSGEVIGSSNDGETALREILVCNPDIVLVDLLLPKLDGNSLVREVKLLKPKIKFIMISQVSDVKLVADSYNSGIEFFISKPINKIEVEKVTSKVAERIEIENMLNNIKKVFKDVNPQKKPQDNNIKIIKHVLSRFGMLGEKGTNDIIKICIYLLETKKSFDECNFNELSSMLGDNPKTIQQRIRRAIKTGLTNLAYIGIEDYYNESFQDYSKGMFDFASVKAEMDYIKGKNKTGGKVIINKFFEGLLLQCEEY
ncbi:chemotaxis protein CheY [Clostridium carboxidivorans P7]|uniref:Stage 0 sporulation protein A homolog n=1 Tax=Clostridium carboxidivorans P7 TaxID=536227 RepID=C6Q120_9CLOT|nr:DNA-binding domain-containing protein [Clostridium carboxidivorans]AKN32889.1 chemotaxis protein CheY [Clostridium carboxidivorans P7]EET84814.1 response regulator receiver protein [Clostridium carboxidivorans P7]EFG89864.1 response regulator receiver domain protein [Clostridium carboxidivorans P7]